MKHIKLFEQFINEQEMSKFVAFRIYSDYDNKNNMNTHMGQFAVPEEIAKKFISDFKLDPNDYNSLNSKSLKKLINELVSGKYLVDEWGKRDLMSTYSVEPWDKTFSKSTGLPLGDYTVIEVE